MKQNRKYTLSAKAIKQRQAAGKLGGKAQTKRKSLAAQRNGKLGGRPPASRMQTFNVENRLSPLKAKLSHNSLTRNLLEIPNISRHQAHKPRS